MAKITQADIKTAGSFITDDDLQSLEGLKVELLKRVDQSRDDGRVYLMQQYVRLVALVSPEIKRIRARFDRETLAASRKELSMLKDEQDAAKEAAKEAAKKQA